MMSEPKVGAYDALPVSELVDLRAQRKSIDELSKAGPSVRTKLLLIILDKYVRKHSAIALDYNDRRKPVICRNGHSKSQ